jgi:hypothetical protein
MNHDFSNFDRKFRRTERTVKAGMGFIIIFKLAIIGLLIFGGVKLVQYLGDNDTSVMKESGKVFQSLKEDFNSGREEVSTDTLVIDTLNVK